MSAYHRSPQRGATVTFRCSPAELQELREAASGAGVSVQTLLERIIFDRSNAADLRPGPATARQAELPLTG